jgi:cysteine desulfurase/selenocysteine lyase
MADFPLLTRADEKNRRWAYLDNAATTQKPRAVLEAVETFYLRENANPHRGAYDLSVAATRALEHARETVRAFIGAARAEEIIFTKGATESINLVARTFGIKELGLGDEIALLVSEHHSNLIPWQYAARATGAKLRYLYTDHEGRVPASEIEEKITPATRLVAAGHISNVTGVMNPVEEIICRAHSVGAKVLVDGTQAAPHIPVDVKALDADFYVFSSHKMLGPGGVGVLYGKRELLDNMPPFLFGGDMIEYVEEQSATFAPLPQKFEAGTLDVGGAVGLAAAIDYLNAIGMDSIEAKERELAGHLLDSLMAVPHIQLVGPKNMEKRIGVVSFNIQGAHPHDVATIVNADHVAIRSGHHCAQPFMKHLGVQSTCRASLYLYNSKDDIDRLAQSLRGVRRWLGYGAQ